MFPFKRDGQSNHSTGQIESGHSLAPANAAQLLKN
jgi:hypothetical protein